MVRSTALLLACVVALAPLMPVGLVVAAPPAEEGQNVVIPTDAALSVPLAEISSVEDWYIVILRDDAPDPGGMATALAKNQGFLIATCIGPPSRALPPKFPLRP